MYYKCCRSFNLLDLTAFLVVHVDLLFYISRQDIQIQISVTWHFTVGFCISGAAGVSVLWSDSSGGGSSAEDCGEGRSHHLHGEGRSRGGGD